MLATHMQITYPGLSTQAHQRMLLKRVGFAHCHSSESSEDTGQLGMRCMRGKHPGAQMQADCMVPFQLHDMHHVSLPRQRSCVQYMQESIYSACKSLSVVHAAPDICKPLWVADKEAATCTWASAALPNHASLCLGGYGLSHKLCKVKAMFSRQRERRTCCT